MSVSLTSKRATSTCRRGLHHLRGLIDCHVHVTAVPGARSMSELAQTAEELIHLRSTYVLRGALIARSQGSMGADFAPHLFLRDASTRIYDCQRHRLNVPVLMSSNCAEIHFRWRKQNSCGRHRRGIDLGAATLSMWKGFVPNR